MHTQEEIVAAFQHHLQRHLEHAPAGIGLLGAYLGAQAVAAGKWVLMPKSILALVVLFLLVDLATGIIKANVRPELTVNSRTGFAGVVKILINVTAVYLLVQLGEAAPFIAAAVQVLMGAPLYTELVSIFENLSDIDDHFGGRNQWIKTVAKRLNILKEQALAVTTLPFQPSPEAPQVPQPPEGAAIVTVPQGSLPPSPIAGGNHANDDAQGD